MKDLIKLLVIMIAYCGVAPLLGSVIASSRKAQRAIFCLMIFMPCLHPGKITLFVDSFEFYRGHTKGFEANWIEVLGVSLIVAAWKNDGAKAAWKWLKPGMVLYLLWVAMSALSLFAAHDLRFGLMAMSKFGKAIILVMAGAHFLKDEEDMRWVVRTIAITSIYYALYCLKLRYLEGKFQVKGSFEHQNPMALWNYMCGICLMAAALHRGVSKRDFILYLSGFGGAALCILLSVSRAGLGALAVGAALVILLAWLRKPTGRVWLVTIGGGAGAMLASVFAMDGMNSRLSEVAESASVSEYDLRDILNMQSKAMVQDSFFGVGWNNFGVMNSRPHGGKYSAILEDWDESRGFRIVEENYYQNPLTESLYWLLLAETGYPGFISYVLFLLATVWFAWRCAWHFKHSLMGTFAASQVITFGILYLHGMVERILTQTKNMSFWLLVCGLISGMEVARRCKPQRPARRLAPAPAPTQRRSLSLSPL
jgi:hypothetical protein